MQTDLGAQCDEFYVSCRLLLKLDLTLQRETILHFFERVRREYPSMGKFRKRDDGALILEEHTPESRGGESQRWLRLETGSMGFGYFSPPNQDAWHRFANFIFDQAPHHLTLSDLDLDHMEVVYGFDMEYIGNHDQLIAETLFVDHPLNSFFLGDEGVRTIDCQPYFGIALTDKCDLQAHLEVKSRTSSFEVSAAEYEAQLLSVYLTVRQYWGFDQPVDLADVYEELTDTANELARHRVVPLMVNPLALAIASRS